MSIDIPKLAITETQLESYNKDMLELWKMSALSSINMHNIIEEKQRVTISQYFPSR